MCSSGEHLATQINFMVHDPLTDEALKKKLVTLLVGWHILFKDDPNMPSVTNLWTQCRSGAKVGIRLFGIRIVTNGLGLVEKRPISHPSPRSDYKEEARLREQKKSAEEGVREEEKLLEKERRELEKQKERESNRAANAPRKPKPMPFNFEQASSTHVVNSLRSNRTIITGETQHHRIRC